MQKKEPIVGDNHFCYLSAFLRFWYGDALKSLPFPPKGLIRAETRRWLPSCYIPASFQAEESQEKGEWHATNKKHQLSCKIHVKIWTLKRGKWTSYCIKQECNECFFSFLWRTFPALGSCRPGTLDLLVWLHSALLIKVTQVWVKGFLTGVGL